MEKRIQKYSVIHGELDIVIKQMNDLLKEGWEPIGNIGTLDGQIFHQSIVKKVQVSPQLESK